MRTCVALAALCLAATALTAQKAETRSISHGGQARTYRLFLPEHVHEGLAPLVVLLHGSGRDGSSLMGPWESLVRKEKATVVLAAPDSLDRQGWNLGSDGPDFLHDVVEAVKQQAPIDARRVYLFGHSAGGHHALAIGLLESQYFAAVAVHAGLLSQETARLLQVAPRKTPIAMWQGTNDPVVPVQGARATRDALNKLGFGTELVELKGHTHDYYGRSAQINAAVWAFFQKQALTDDPVFQKYMFGK